MRWRDSKSGRRGRRPLRLPNFNGLVGEGVLDLPKNTIPKPLLFNFLCSLFTRRSRYVLLSPQSAKPPAVSPAGSVGASALWRRGVHRTPASLNNIKRGTFVGLHRFYIYKQVDLM